MKIKAVIHPAEEGGYWAEVPALPGCITEGETIDEVMANLKDAIEGWIDVANSRQMAQSKEFTKDGCLSYADDHFFIGIDVTHKVSV